MGGDIGKIDPNLRAVAALSESDIVFHDVRSEPFQVFGLCDYREEPVFRRMPERVVSSLGQRISELARNTSGGRVRFRTSSRYLPIQAEMPAVTTFPHMTLAGSAGFDVYVGEPGKSAYHGTLMPPLGVEKGYEAILYFADAAERELTLNFPLYSEVKRLRVGLQKSAGLARAGDYRYKTPVVFYGSSITQGGCASRPGNSYPSILSRICDCDYINLGFSGNAKGEALMADYIAQLRMSAFVYDYDHNAPDLEHLQATHEPFFRRIREKQPSLPVIILSKPDICMDRQEDLARRETIYKTYLNAKSRGDKNVYFIDGEELFRGDGRDGCTVDGCHPNDLGFFRMAEKILPVLSPALAAD